MLLILGDPFVVNADPFFFELFDPGVSKLMNFKLISGRGKMRFLWNRQRRPFRVS